MPLDESVLCVSERDFLNPSNLLFAYRNGIFPWLVEDYPFVPWHSPPKRALLFFDQLHIPKNLRKARAKTDFTFTMNKCFRRVVELCGKVSRKGQNGTWIDRDIIENYTILHEEGYAHSVEVWNAAGEIVGGLYGVDCGVFCGESMFHFETNASKFALLHLVEFLQSRGDEWLDAQVMTLHLQMLGAVEIERRKYLRLLKETVE